MPYPYKTLREWLVEEEELGNVVRVKTPIKCGDYSNIVDIGNGIPGKQPETEMRALVRYLHTLPGKPIGIIENPINNRPRTEPPEWENEAIKRIKEKISK